MSDCEYRMLQDRFSAKLKGYCAYSGNKKAAYEAGILVCKSILKEIYEREKKKNGET